MRRNSFLGQVLTAVARSTPVANPVRDLTTAARPARPASQLLTAIARATPAFTPGGNQTLVTRLRASRQPAPPVDVPHAAPDAGRAGDVIDFGRQLRSARQRRSYRQALVVVLAAFAVPVIIASFVIVKAALSPRAGVVPIGGMSHSAHRVSHRASASALMAALTLANQSTVARGMLPPSTCKQQGPDMVTCTAPALGINAAVFRTYPNLTALYAAYTAKVASLSPSSKFRQNFSDCGLQQTVGEVGWNHQFQHPKTYTVSQMSKGQVTEDQVAGRVYCNFSQSLEYFVWTQDSGRLMGVVTGPLHENVWNWWVAIHHNIGLGGASMNMNAPPSPSADPAASG